MSKLERAYRNVAELAEAITENDGNELETLLLDNSAALISSVLSATDYFERNCSIDKLIDRLAKKRAAQLWVEQPHIYAASASEIFEMEEA